MRNVQHMTTSTAGAMGLRGAVAATKTTKTP